MYLAFSRMNRRSSVSTSASLMITLAPKFLGGAGALEDLRAIGAVLGEKGSEGKGEVGELIEFG